jgi:hypothetical protein
LDLLNLRIDRFDHVGEFLVSQQPEAPGFVHGIDPEAVEDDARRGPKARVELGALREAPGAEDLDVRAGRPGSSRAALVMAGDA